MDKLKFFADVNLEESVVKTIRSYDHDIKRISDIDCFMNDEEIVKLGIREKRIIVTEDKDFGEIIFKNKISCFGIILIRVNAKTLNSLEKRIEVLSELLEFQNDEIIDNFIVITETKFRINEL
jgi:predicted nuclease of predicted toxin-antitoxin system